MEQFIIEQNWREAKKFEWKMYSGNFLDQHDVWFVKQL